MAKKPVTSTETTRSGRRRGTNILIWTAAAIGIALLAYLLYLNLRSPGEIEGLIRQSGLSRAHDNSVQFTAGDAPPAGGVHFDRWQNCGVYEEPIETGNAVHSLEHGAVWITYRPDLAESAVTALQERVRQQSFLLLSPYPGQQSPIVLTAWAVQLEVDSVRDSRIDEFITRYRLGPTTPELGATCSRGVGTPVS